jgi:hypothetical protein
MFLKKDPSLLDKEIDRLTAQLKNQIVGAEEYRTTIDMISKLNALKNDQESQRISKEKWLLAGTNLLGIVLVINHERVNVITTQAMSMVTRNKV